MAARRGERWGYGAGIAPKTNGTRARRGARRLQGRQPSSCHEPMEGRDRTVDGPPNAAFARRRGDGSTIPISRKKPAQSSRRSGSGHLPTAPTTLRANCDAVTPNSHDADAFIAAHHALSFGKIQFEEAGRRDLVSGGQAGDRLTVGSMVYSIQSPPTSPPLRDGFAESAVYRSRRHARKVEGARRANTMRVRSP